MEGFLELRMIEVELNDLFEGLGIVDVLLTVLQLFPKATEVIVRAVIGPWKVLILIEIVESRHTCERLCGRREQPVLPSIKQKMGWQSRMLHDQCLALRKSLWIKLFPIDFRTFLGYISILNCGKMVAENVEIIKNRIREVCLRCGRKPEDVLLLGVSKTFGIDKIREAVSAGLFDIGENYTQELDEKRNQLNDDRVRWHFIGHLQTNKVKYIADYIHLIQSVDNDRVAEEIQKRADRVNRTVDVLVEVHTTDEATKFGVLPEKTVDLIKCISAFNRVRVLGLMTMGPFSDDPDDSRPSFQQLADLGKRITKEGIENVAMQHLSMGMSHDFEVAIEEGATIVRIGTRVFGERSQAA